MADISHLLGQTIARVSRASKDDRTSLSPALEDDWISFSLDDDFDLVLQHHQDCCEHVYLDDVAGNLDDLVGSKIWQAEEVSNEAYADTDEEQWTFYLLRTIKGSVTLRWNGTSNGYYSMGVDADWLYRGRRMDHLGREDRQVAEDLLESRYGITARQ